MSDFSDIKTILDRQGEAWRDFEKRQDGKLADLQAQIDTIAKKAGRPSFSISDDAGEWSTADRRSFNNFLRAGAAPAWEAKAMSVNSDPDGGFFAPAQFSSDITRRLFEASPMRSMARVVSIEADSFEEISDADDVVASWIGETDARPVTTSPRIGKLTIPTHEIYALPLLSARLLEDANIDLGAWLEGKASDRFARLEGSAFVSGDGIAKPRGILSYPTAATSDATRAWGTVEHVATGVSGDFAASNKGDKLIDLTYRLKAPYRANASWMMNRATANELRQFKEATTSGYLWQPGLAAGQPDRLLGFEIVLSEDMPSKGANSLSIAFGDFRAGYTIVDRLGVQVLRDPFTQKPHVAFYVRRRVGGALANSEAIKFLKFSAS